MRCTSVVANVITDFFSNLVARHRGFLVEKNMQNISLFYVREPVE